MEILWTEEALDDLASIIAYYSEELSPAIAESIGARIVEHIEALPPFPDRARKSERTPGTRELLIARLPFIAFFKRKNDKLIVLNIVHTARNFPSSN